MSWIARDSPANEVDCPKSRTCVMRDAFVPHLNVQIFEIFNNLNFDNVFLSNKPYKQIIYFRDLKELNPTWKKFNYLRSYQRYSIHTSHKRIWMFWKCGYGEKSQREDQRIFRLKSRKTSKGWPLLLFCPAIKECLCGHSITQWFIE
jgi:hypothetical protein